MLVEQLGVAASRARDLFEQRRPVMQEWADFLTETMGPVMQEWADYLTETMGPVIRKLRN